MHNNHFLFSFCSYSNIDLLHQSRYSLLIVVSLIGYEFSWYLRVEITYLWKMFSIFCEEHTVLFLDSFFGWEDILYYNAWFLDFGENLSYIVYVLLGFEGDFLEATLFLVIVLISISSIGRILSWSISPLKCKDIGLLSIFMVYCILTKIVCIRFSLVLKMFTKRIELFLV
jgi:hypothetical protein